jgi:nicotinamidase-related amidase
MTAVTGSSPYPWPWNGDLSPDGTACLVIGPRSGGPKPDVSASATVSTLATAVAASGGVVVRVTTAPPRARPAGRAQLAGPESDSFADLSAHLHVDSIGIDGFFGTPLDAHLRRHGVERLILTGAGLETCVHSTMRSANDRGYECLLVLDATLPHDPDLAAASVSMIEMSGGIFGAVATSQSVLDALATLAPRDRSTR